MAFFEELGRKAKDVAAVAADKAKDMAAVAADKARETTELTKLSVAIAGEQRELEKNYRLIGEWFMNEYDGELPEGVSELAAAVAASKAKIAELEEQKTAVKSESAVEAEGAVVEPAAKVCPVCGAESDSKFCPKCGAPMSMNLRCDAAFVEGAGWHAAAARYQDFVEKHRDSAILYLELGVGLNTPGIIKYNFWQQTYNNPNAVYVCVNQAQAWAPNELEGRAMCVEGDIGEFLKLCE